MPLVGRMANQSTSTGLTGRMVSPQTDTALVGRMAVNKTEPTTEIKTLPEFLGGGAYNSVKGDPNKLINTGHSTYDGVQTKKGYERADIFPVSLGGVNQDKRNITYEQNLPEYDKASEAKNNGQSYNPNDLKYRTATDKYLQEEVLPKYKSGEINLREAQVLATSFLRNQKEGLDTNPYSFNNLVGGLKSVLSKGSSIVRSAANLFVPSQEQLKQAYENAKPTIIKGQEIPSRATSIGLIDKHGDKYSGIDPAGAVGSLEDVSKNAIKNVSKKIAQSNNLEEIIGFVKSVFKNKPAEEIKTISEPLVNITKESEVKNILTNSSKSRILPEAKTVKRELTKTEMPVLEATAKDTKQISQAPKLFPENISYEQTTPKPNFSQGADVELKDVLSKPDIINTNNLNISDKAKKVINDSVAEVKPLIESKIGSRLTNKEVMEYADNSSRTLQRAVGQEQTKEWEAALLKTRQKLASMAESGTVDKEYLDTLTTLKTHATDVARKLQSFSIGADPKNVTAKQVILDQVLKVTDDTDKILEAAKGIDFNDANQAAKFYREFIKPKAGEWIDLIRYNSMLSSPNTHLNNASVNLINTTLIGSIEKTLTGGLDFIGSKITGQQRKAFAGEGVKFLQGYVTHLKDATQKFSDVMTGRRAFTNLDTRSIPIATEGVKGKVVSALSYPLRLLEASDQFFSSLAEGGERAALTYRQGKGVLVKNLEEQAKDDAAYRLFRQNIFNEDQGHVLDAIDQLTNKIEGLRKSNNPIVSTVAKFTVPFVKTPMNIFKQGIEYSPAGVTTLWGAKNKTQQLSKALIGSAVFAGASTLLASDRLTWSEPTDETQKNLWREAGRQPYSVKVGNKWISYQKLAPAVAFPLAMVSSLDDLRKSKKIDDDTVDLTLKAIAKYGQFLADQSYAKSIGDLINIPKGGEAAISQAVSNYPQQLIPYRAFSGWLARMLDDSQRKVDNKASFIDKQMQLLMMNIPGLSQKVPARMNVKGEPIKNQNRFMNAVLPAKVTPENPELTNFLNDYESLKKDTNTSSQQKKITKDQFKPVFDEIRNLVNEGRIDEAQQKLDSLSDADYKLYKKYRQSEKTSSTNETKVEIYATYNQIQNLVKEGKTEEAQKILDGLTDEEYRAYKSLKNSMPTI